MSEEVPIIGEDGTGGYWETFKDHQDNIIKRIYHKMENFIPTDYKVPEKQSNYTRFQEGLNRIRILSPMIFGEVYFNNDNKPTRSKKGFDRMPEDIKKDGKIKHFWAFVVWNYQTEHIQVCEITQSTIQASMMALVDNPKWGSPDKYDIAITRTGEGLETSYTVQAEPPIGEPEETILKAYEETTINLENLYKNGDPFKE